MGNLRTVDIVAALGVYKRQLNWINDYLYYTSHRNALLLWGRRSQREEPRLSRGANSEGLGTIRNTFYNHCIALIKKQLMNKIA